MKEFARRIKSYLVGEPALGTTNAVKGATATSGAAVTTIDAGLTDPDVPRNITVTAGGTAANIKAVQVTITGTDIRDNEITEDLPAFTVDTAGTKAGSKAFKTVTEVSIPAMDGAGVTVAVGVGDKLGLPDKLHRDTVVNAFLDDAREGTRPTVATDDESLADNTVDLDSALNGDPVRVDYYRTT